MSVSIRIVRFFLPVWCLLSGATALAASPRQDPLLIAEVALERAQFGVAIAQYRQAYGVSHDAKLAERGARIAYENLQFRPLAAVAREWLAQDPSSELAHRFAAIAALELGDQGTAVRELRTLVRTAYKDPAEAFESLAQTLGDLRNEYAVSRAIQSVAEDYPTLAEAQLAVARRSLSGGDATRARAAAERALSLRPGARNARTLLARAAVASGDCTAGLQGARELAADSSDGDRLLLAWLLTACDRSAEARPYFVELARASMVRAEALEGLADLELEAHRFDEATARYNELLATGRNAERALQGLAVVADRRGDFARAAELYRRVTSGSAVVPAQLRAYRLLAEHGRRAEAARSLDAFLVAAPEHRVAVTAGRAELLADLGEGAQASRLLSRAIATYPDVLELKYARATVLERGGAPDAAIAELRGVVREHPTDPIACNALGFTLADHRRHLDEAQRLISGALAVRPDSAAIQDSMGWVLYRRGENAEALKWLEKAHAADPDPEIAYHLGEVRWALGDRSGARQTWQDALDKSPSERRLREAMARPVATDR